MIHIILPWNTCHEHSSSRGLSHIDGGVAPPPPPHEHFEVDVADLVLP